ncbi:VOC family protein [Vreelandella alkaliphila]|uniref:VOC family protein n=1 Tax=Halomonadaceae TaxID=28256 RepID=UPI000E9CF866|nr:MULTISPECIES: VOC family protein [unclassified Halomonas]WKD29344.1 hypothetical protein NDQ72_05160 [Halomonas sp. KG2]HBP40361.1 hypothetical protein [Halomonas sp.]HBS82621.1 hypothetical protein [Halomonas campaniensis]
MSKPAKSGVIIYSNSVKPLAEFYIEMFGMALLRETDDFISIGGDGINLIIHLPPVEMPEQNFNAVKLFLTVESHEYARKKVVELGGKALEGEWSNPVFKVCNVVDPEGNHIQIREFKL